MMIKMVMAFKRIGKDKRGFTLVELMAVLAVLAIIAAIAVPRFTGTINTAKENADKASAQIIARAAEQKYLDEQSTGTKTYVISNNNNDLADYLKDVPKTQDSPQNSWVAKVVDGKCTGVYYGSTVPNDEDDGNLLKNE